MTEYEELKKEAESVGASLCYVVIGGSRAYGTNNDKSDLDLRGCYTLDPREYWKITKRKDEIELESCDAVAYELRKYVGLLSKCNPNVIETLGVRDRDVVYMDAAGQKIRDSKEMFLSKRAYVTFVGYAEQQLRRLENALARDSYPQEEKEKHISKSLNAMMLKAEMEYDSLDGTVKFGVEDGSVCVDMHVHAPLRDLVRFNSNVQNMLKNYDRLTGRNKKKDDEHLRKHAMHLLRLYMMAEDILLNKEIVTYREKEHDLLMSVRNGEVGWDKVFEMQEKMRLELDKAYEKSKLEEEPDMEKVNELIVEIMEMRK